MAPTHIIPERPFTAAPALKLLTLDRAVAQRIVHVMEIGVRQLETDVLNFDAAATEFEANPPVEDPTGATVDLRGPHFAEGMRSMAQEFIRYIAEANEIIEVLEQVQYGPLGLALVTDSADADEASEVIAEALLEAAI